MESRTLLLECLADAARAAVRGVVWGLFAVCLVALAYPVAARAEVPLPFDLENWTLLEAWGFNAAPGQFNIPGPEGAEFDTLVCLENEGCSGYGYAAGLSLYALDLTTTVYDEFGDPFFGTNAGAIYLQCVSGCTVAPPESAASEVALATLVAASAAASAAEASAESAAQLVQLGGVLFWCLCTGLSFFGYSVGARDV